MTLSNTLISEHTLNWVRSFVIKYNLCPFAKIPVTQGTLRISVSEALKQTQALEVLMAEIHLLDEHPKIETTLLVFSHAFNDFFTYLDFVESAEQLMHQLEYEGIYQLATFHPDYYFADTEPDDVSNYTNRSPYPMVHLLREDSLDKAIAAYGDTDKIPEHNKARLHQLGSIEIASILRAVTK